MVTMKISEKEDHTFKNVDDAIKYMYETKFERDISVYDINSDKALKKIQKIYEAIKEYNKGKPLNEQILPTNPYGFRGILGCLGVMVYDIALGTYERNHKCIALFTGFNESVLDTSIEPADVRPSLKALSSLVMIMGS